MRRRNVLMPALTVSVVLAVSIGVVAAGTRPASQFVTRSGRQLRLGGASYRFTGFNVWRANVASWNRPPNTGYDLNDGTWLSTTLRHIKEHGARINVIRVWFFQQLAIRRAAYDWSAFDKTLRTAKAHGFRVIATLADEWSYLGTLFKDATWYRRGYAEPVEDPYEVHTYRRYVQDVVRRYKDDPTILAWEMVNEPDVAVTASQDTRCVADAGSILSAFVRDVGGLIKRIDHNHLVSLGAAGNGMCGTIAGDYARVMSEPSIDLCSFHDYYGPRNTTAFDPYNGLNVRTTQCFQLNKPLYVGEVGIHADAAPCRGSVSCRAHYLREKLAAAFDRPGVVGYLAWQYDDRGYAGGRDDLVYGPRDPSLRVLSQYAETRG